MKLDDLKKIVDEENKNITDTNEMRMRVIERFSERTNLTRFSKLIQNSNLRYIVIVLVAGILVTLVTSYLKTYHENRNNLAPTLINTKDPMALAGTTSPEVISGTVTTPQPNPSPDPTKTSIQVEPEETLSPNDIKLLGPEGKFDVSKLIGDDSKTLPYDNNTIRQPGFFYYATDSVSVILKEGKIDLYDSNLLSLHNMKIIDKHIWGNNMRIAIKISDNTKQGVINSIKLLDNDNNVLTAEPDFLLNPN